MVSGLGPLRLAMRTSRLVALPRVGRPLHWYDHGDNTNRLDHQTVVIFEIRMNSSKCLHSLSVGTGTIRYLFALCIVRTSILKQPTQDHTSSSPATIFYRCNKWAQMMIPVSLKPYAPLRCQRLPQLIFLLSHDRQAPLHTGPLNLLFTKSRPTAIPLD